MLKIPTTTICTRADKARSQKIDPNYFQSNFTLKKNKSKHWHFQAALYHCQTYLYGRLIKSLEILEDLQSVNPIYFRRSAHPPKIISSLFFYCLPRFVLFLRLKNHNLYNLGKTMKIIELQWHTQ